MVSGTAKLSQNALQREGFYCFETENITFVVVILNKIVCFVRNCTQWSALFYRWYLT